MKLNFSCQSKFGVQKMLCANGREGQAQHQIYLRRILRSKIRILVAAEARNAPSVPFSAALRAANSVGKISESLIMVDGTGLEPVTLRM